MLPTPKTLIDHCEKEVLWEIHVFEDLEFGSTPLYPYLPCDPTLLSNCFTTVLVVF